MTKITAQCELMHNALSTSALDPDGQFYVIQDSQGEPMVFTIGKNGKLYLLMKGINGNERVDLSAKFKVPQNHRITAIGISQNVDSTFQLLFASGQPGSPGTIWVVQPTKPANMDWLEVKDLTSKLISFGGQHREMLVNKFIMCAGSNVTDGNIVFVIYQDVVRQTEAFCALQIDPNRWTFDQDIEPTTNAARILDLCAGNLSSGSGLFVLYKDPSSDVLQMRFLRVSRSGTYTTIMPTMMCVPPGTTQIECMINSNGHTDLVLSCNEGLLRVPADDVEEDYDPDYKFSTLSKEPAFQQSSKLHVAQSVKGNIISFWSLTRDSSLYYQEFKTGKQKLIPVTKEAVPLVQQTQGRARDFYASQHSTLGQDVYIVDETSQLLRLQQNIDTRIWDKPRTVSFLDVESLDEFTSYTTLVKVEGDDGQLKPKYAVKICASFTTEVIINGRTVRLYKDSQDVLTDAAGTITIILHAGELNAPIITIKDGSLSTVVNPMDKVMKSICQVTSAEQLRNIKLANGQSLISSDVKQEDLESAVKSLQQINEAAKSFNHDGSKSDFVSPQPVVMPSCQPVMFDFIGALTTGFKTMTNFVVSQVKEGWAFVVTLGNKVLDFVLSTVTHVAQAVSKVFEFIKVKIEQLVEWVGQIFNWPDIVETHNIFVNVANSGLLWGLDHISELDVHVTHFFKTLREHINIDPDKLPTELNTIKVGKDGANQAKKKGGPDNPEVTEKKNSPSANYGVYHMKQATSDLGDEFAMIAEVWTKVTDIMSELGKLATQLWTDLTNLFKKDDVSLQDLVKILVKHLATNVLDILEKLVHLIVTIILDLAVIIIKGLNKAVKIPVLSTLYTKISGGAELTILDAVCLILAIPTTIIYKVVKNGEAPAKHADNLEMAKPNIFRARIESKLLDSSRLAGKELAEQKTVSRANVAATPMNSSANKLPQDAGVSYSVSTNLAKASKVIRTLVEPEKHTTGSAIKALAPPIGSGIWFTWVTVPSFVADVTPGVNTVNLLKIAAKVFLIYMQKPSAEHATEADFDIRQSMWYIAFIPAILGTLAGKQLRALIEIVVGGITNLLLVAAHITVGVVDKTFDALKLIDEFINNAGVITSALAASTNGDPATSLVAVIVSDVGYILRFKRMLSDQDGLSSVIQT